MGLVQTYYCDACKRHFGETTHLNLKSSNLFVSYYEKQSLKHPEGWRQKRCLVNCKEYHFCDQLCLNKWLNELVDRTKGAINEEE